MLWLFIVGGCLLGFIAGILYLDSRVKKSALLTKLTGGSKWKNRLLGLGIILAAALVLFLTMGMVNTVIVFLHVVLIWLLCDLGGFIIKRISGRSLRVYFAGIAAIVISAAYLSWGYYCANHVWVTPYSMTTEKDVGEGIHAVLVSDSHVGTTFHWQGFTEYMEQISAENPDVVLVCGDFVDDDTSEEDMIKCCEALGNLETKYGVYFVYGNHDKGYYNTRSYTGEDLENELVKNGVIVLNDESVLVDDRFYIIGRQDAEVKDRADMETLMEGLDTSKYMIVLDHEPHDYEVQQECGVDMVLSGHTHGGQFFPINKAGEWSGVNDQVYGYERLGTADFIVTSGISDWAVKFKTGCISEYCVIDITSVK